MNHCYWFPNLSAFGKCNAKILCPPIDVCSKRWQHLPVLLSGTEVKIIFIISWGVQCTVYTVPSAVIKLIMNHFLLMWRPGWNGHRRKVHDPCRVPWGAGGVGVWGGGSSRNKCRCECAIALFSVCLRFVCRYFHVAVQLILLEDFPNGLAL